MIQKSKTGLDPLVVAYLMDGDDPSFTDVDRFFLWCLRAGFAEDGNDPRELWEQHRKRYLPLFISENPCRRPLPWWKYEAPEARRRIGGNGTPDEDAGLEYGLPGDWEDESLDPADRPTFESQAAFLARHGLLSKTEQKWLAANPAALEPERVSLDWLDLDDGTDAA